MTAAAAKQTYLLFHILLLFYVYACFVVFFPFDIVVL